MASLLSLAIVDVVEGIAGRADYSAVEAFAPTRGVDAAFAVRARLAVAAPRKGFALLTRACAAQVFSCTPIAAFVVA